MTERKKGEEEVQLIRALDYDCHSGGSAVQCWFEALWVLLLVVDGGDNGNTISYQSRLAELE